MKTVGKCSTVVLLDYNTNCDIEDWSAPLSHAGLIKAYIDGNYPECPTEYQTIMPSMPKPLSEIALSEGNRVHHEKFGQGTVIDLNHEGDRITVQFDSAGLKTLALAYVRLEKR